ncbi:hypothetical protein EV424DRAFT_1474896 [Suillus variegatus]|nr:hypothetical protein EV424DRAFT_1474896 [Suillus variegatus]
MTHSVEAAYGLGKTNLLNKAVRIPGKNQFNQAGEVAVIPIGLQNGLTNHLQNWEDQGWIGVMNSELFKAMAYHLQKRAAMTAFHWIKGHSGIWGNEEADKLAGIGAKLSQITQATAYQGIMSLLEIMRHTVGVVSKTQETDQTIWLSRHHKDLSKKFQNFVFGALHNSLKTTESIEHIFVECNHPARKLIWHLAKCLWLHEDTPWPDASLGTILGSGTLSVYQRLNRNEDTE